MNENITPPGVESTPQPNIPTISEIEKQQNHQVAFVGATFLPKWTKEADGTNPDATRGKQVLDNIRNLLDWGYKVVMIDGGSNDAFLQELSTVGNGEVVIKKQKSRSLSGAQREGYQAASELPETKVIMTTQPEKPFTYEDMRNFTRPVLEGDADMVIPYRTSELGDYPPEQKYYENRGNQDMSEALQKVGLLPKGTILDIYNGTRIVKNDPEAIRLLSVQHDEKTLDFFKHLPKQYVRRIKNVFKRLFNKPTVQTNREFLDPDAWFASLYGPVAAFAVHGKRIVSVDSDYMHPQEQTRQETGNPKFDIKRYQQYMAIVPYFYDYLIKLLREHKMQSKSTD